MWCHFLCTGAFLPPHVASSAVMECPHNTAIQGHSEGERHSVVLGARSWQANVLGRGRSTNGKREVFSEASACGAFLTCQARRRLSPNGGRLLLGIALFMEDSRI